MLDLTDVLLGDVLLAAPGCPDVTAEQAIARSARQFCMDTHAWRHTSSELTVVKGFREVDLELPRDTSIVRLFWVTLGMYPLTGVSASKLSDQEGTVKGYALGHDGRLLLDRRPAQTLPANLTAQMALAPVRGSAELPDELEPFFDCIVQLATAHLLSMPGVEWRDRAGAADAMTFYHQQSLAARRFGNQRDQPIHRTVKYGGL